MYHTMRTTSKCSALYIISGSSPAAATTLGYRWK